MWQLYESKQKGVNLRGQLNVATLRRQSKEGELTRAN